MWRISLSDLNYDEQERQSVADVLSSRWLTMGPRTEEFEAKVAAYLGVRHAIAVANCTCALELVYRCLLAGSRDAVVVPDITFVATANAARVQGGTVYLADVSSASLPLISAEFTKRVLVEACDRVAAIAVVHYAGFNAATAAIRELAADHGVPIVEDAAHAIGSNDAEGRKLGTVGIAGCFSFFSNKNLATGEGGLVATNDDELARAVRLCRCHGMTSLTYERHQGHRYGYDVVEIGHNYRCTEITAALGLVQLAKLDQGNERRRDLYRLYAGLLKDCEAVQVAFAEDPVAVGQSACHILPLLCRDTQTRDAIRRRLGDAGIQSSHHYAPLSSFTAYRSEAPVDQYSNSAEYASREITLPLYPTLLESQVEEICSIVAGKAT